VDATPQAPSPTAKCLTHLAVPESGQKKRKKNKREEKKTLQYAGVPESGQRGTVEDCGASPRIPLALQAKAVWHRPTRVRTSSPASTFFFL